MKISMIHSLLLAAAGLATGCAGDPVTPDDIIDVTISDQHVYYADGLTTVPVTIAINPEAGSEFRTVTVTTDAGTFTGGESTLTLDFSVKNTETLELMPGTVPGKFIVKAEIGSTKKYSNEEILTLARLPQDRAIGEIQYDKPGALVGDGEAELVFYVRTGLKSALKFEANPGGFRTFGAEPAPALTVVPDPASHIATAIFRVDRRGGVYEVRISTTEAAFDTLLHLAVDTAYASHMALQLDKAQLDHGGDQVNIQALFSRLSGQVSVGIPVKFTAVLERTGEALTAFSTGQAQTGTDEVAATRFTLEPDKAEKDDRIIFSAETLGGPPFKETRTLKVF